MNPLVSVIMPVYNAEKYVSEAIESILEQTYKNIEFVIIDDGSTDGTINILKQYAKLDCRIKLISRPNKGVARSLNEAIDNCNGKYIARMDADDYSYNYRIEKQVDFLEKNTEYVMCGGDIYVNGDRKRVAEPKSYEAILAFAFLGCPFAHPTVMWRREEFESYGMRYSELYASEDYELWCRLIKRGRVVNLDIPLLRYRVSGNNISLVNQKKIYDSNNKIRKEYCHNTKVNYCISQAHEIIVNDIHEVEMREKYFVSVLQNYCVDEVGLKYILNCCMSCYLEGLKMSARKVKKRVHQKFDVYYSSKKMRRMMNSIIRSRIVRFYIKRAMSQLGIFRM